MACGERTVIEVLGLEFVEGGNTIWIHGRGGTVLRIQCTGQIVAATGCVSPVAHADVRVEGDIAICIPDQVNDDGRSHGP